MLPGGVVDTLGGGSVGPGRDWQVRLTGQDAGRQLSRLVPACTRAHRPLGCSPDLSGRQLVDWQTVVDLAGACCRSCRTVGRFGVLSLASGGAWEALLPADVPGKGGVARHVERNRTVADEELPLGCSRSRCPSIRFVGVCGDSWCSRRGSASPVSPVKGATWRSDCGSSEVAPGRTPISHPSYRG